MNKFLKNKNSGYTLVELSISITIISLLLTSGIAFFGKKIFIDRDKLTKERLAYIQDAIDAFYQLNAYIPCPAPGKSVETNNLHGTFGGNPLVNYFDDTTKRCLGGAGVEATPNETGMVPVRILNILDEYAYDGWGRKFTYRIGRGMGNPTTFADIDYRSEIIVRDLSGNELTTTSEIPPDNYGAAYIIISHAKNGANVAWYKNNPIDPNPNAATGPEFENADHDQNEVYIQDYTTASFDDILVYKTKKQFTGEIFTGTSPIRFSNYTCTNAGKIVTTGVGVSGIYLNTGPAITSSFQTIFNNYFGKSAAAMKRLCDHPPDVCAFSPNLVSGLKLWLDGTNPNMDTVAAPTSDTVISNWYNHATLTSNATQGSGAKPKFVLNSDFSTMEFTIPAIDFQGGGYFNIDLSFIKNVDYTVFVVEATKPNTARGFIIGATPNCATNCGINVGYDPSYSSRPPYAGNQCGSNELDIPVPYRHSNDPRPTIFRYGLNRDSNLDITGMSSNILEVLIKNGEQIKTQKFNNIAPITNSSPINSYIGKNSGGGNYNGQVGEILIYNRFLNQDEVTMIYQYLINRWFNGACR
jgi:prepilin-type N-terminal cleavage/methylation domain-containing protein